MKPGHFRNLRAGWLFFALLTFEILKSSLLFSQPVHLQLSGYAKNLGVSAKSFFSGESFFYDLTRLRTKATLDLGPQWHSEIWLDTEVMAGSYLTTLDYQFSKRLVRPTYFDLDWRLRESRKVFARQRLFRAFVSANLGEAQVTVGRQRIAWGTGFAWNPTDLLNPFNPFAIEREEKEGVDAIYADIPLGVLSRLEAAFAPGKNKLKPRSAIRVHSNFKGYDFSLMAGNFQKDWIWGGDFAGYIGGAGFRGEWAYTQKHRGPSFLRAILNADYNFPHDYYLMVEFYFNGQGTADKKKYNVMALLSGETYSLARHYVAALISKNLTPLLRLDAYLILNLDDRSNLIGPAFTYSLANNWELILSGYFFNGARDSELGGLKTSFFGILQFYF